MTVAAVDHPWWWRNAACQDVDPNLFHPARGESSAEAKAVCARCSVRLDCLAWALTHDEQFGIWGGLSEPERRQLR